MAATSAPLLRPNSAVALPVMICSSESMSGLKRVGEKFDPLALVSLESMPSSVMFTARSLAPLTCTPPPVLAPTSTPG